MDRKLIFEKRSASKPSTYFGSDAALQDVSAVLPAAVLRGGLDLPDIGEFDAVRHYSNLTNLSFSVDKNFYPLGSCTMKYNPKINEDMAALEGFVGLHPYQNEADIQGAMELIFNLQELLCKVTGMSRFTLQPASGAHGEFTGMLMIKKYQNENAMVEYIESGIDKTAIMLDLSNKYNIVITFPNNLIYNGFDKLFNTIYLIFGIQNMIE